LSYREDCGNRRYLPIPDGIQILSGEISSTLPKQQELRMSPYSWIRFGTDVWLLGFEATNVIALRMMRLAAGGPLADAEAQRMVREKMLALWTLQSRAMIGAWTAPKVARGSLRHYRKVVRANRRRLSRQ